MSKIVCRGSIVGSKLCLLLPCAAAWGVNKGCARAIGAIAVVRSADDGSVRGAPQMETAYGDRPSETFFSLADLSTQFPPIVVQDVYFGVVFGMRSYDYRSRYDIDSAAAYFRFHPRRR